MDNENRKEVSALVVTFVSYFGAGAFAKRVGSVASMRPVPRSLSSSCGTCVFLPPYFSLEAVVANVNAELAEAVYRCGKEGNYEKIHDF